MIIKTDSVIHRSGTLRLGIFLALAVALSACSKAQLIGKGNKVRTIPVQATSITPDSGPIQGGTQVTIQGSGFFPGTTVTIGGVPCLGVDVISATTMTCTTGSTFRGGIDQVDITTPMAANNSLSFSYLEPIQAVATTISAGGVFSTSGQIRVRATIGVVSGVSPGNISSGPDMIMLGGLQGVISANNPSAPNP